MGANTNCIAANTKPSHPPYTAARLRLSPVTSTSSLGYTGMMSPNPMESRSSVTAMNASACLRICWVLEEVSVSRALPGDANIYVGSFKFHEEPDPEREVHLLRSCAGDVSEVDHFLPAQSGLQKIDHLGLGFRVVS